MTTTPRLPIVVGFDGSTESEAALSFAATQADWYRVPLRIVHGYSIHRPLIMAGYAPYQPELGFPLSAARQMVEDAAQRLAHSHSHIDVECAVRGGSPGANLVDESGRATLVAVGAQGHGAVAGLLLGSVASRLTAHGRCPVVVVRDGTRAVIKAPVVVGVEGTHDEAAAIDFAFEQARAAGVHLQAVHVWSDRPDFAPWTETYQARVGLAEALAPAAQRYPDVAVDLYQERDRHPATALRDFAAMAGLVVVSRHGGNAVSRLFASVGDVIVREAPCSVAVVPGKGVRP